MKRVLISQPTLPNYRVDFFERLAALVNAEGGEIIVHYAQRDALGVSAAKVLPQGVRFSIKKHQPWPLSSIAPLYLPLIPCELIEWAEVVVVPGHIREPDTLLSVLWSRKKKRRVIWWGSLPPHRPPLTVALTFKVLTKVDAIAAYMPSQREALPPELRRKTRSLNNGLKPLLNPPSAPLSTRPLALCVIGRPSEKSRIFEWLPLLRGWAAKGARSEGLAQAREVHLLGTSERDVMTLDPTLINDLAREGLTLTAHGYLEREEELLAVLGRCRLAFYPGSIGLSLLEAMRAGLPTLLAAPPAPHMPEREAFIEWEVGRLFTLREALSESDWGERLHEALTDEAWLDEAQGRCFTQSELFSTKHMAREMYALIKGELLDP